MLDALRAFEALRKRLLVGPVYVTPNFSKPFIIECDVLGTGIGLLNAGVQTRCLL